MKMKPPQLFLRLIAPSLRHSTYRWRRILASDEAALLASIHHYYRILSSSTRNSSSRSSAHPSILRTFLQTESTAQGGAFYERLYRRSTIDHLLRNAVQLTSDLPKRDKPPVTSEHAKEGSEKEDGDPDDGDPIKELRRLMLRFMPAIWGVFLITFVALLLDRNPSDAHADTANAIFVTWNEFLHQMLAKGEVRQIVVRPNSRVATIFLHDGAVVAGRRADQQRYFLRFGDSQGDLQGFEERLRAAEERLGIAQGDRVQVVYVRDQAGEWILLLSLIALAAFFLFRNASTKAPRPTGTNGGGNSGAADSGGGGLFKNPFASMTRARFTLVDPVRPEASNERSISLADVAGMHEAKQEVMEFVDYLRHPEKYAALGARLPRGALLLGPPGCGKTLLAKAVATDGDVPFLQMNGSEFVEMIGGLGAARVRDLFVEARKRAPCIIYIDEIDALGRRRIGTGGGDGMSGGANDEAEQTLNQLLVEMDGMDTTGHVLLLGSTNRPDVLDRALLRPGRFDRHITIELPTPAERSEIFELYLRKLRLHLELPLESEGATSETERKRSLVTSLANQLASMTSGMSGADIANMVNEAALRAASAASKAVDKSDLEYALDKISRGAERRNTALSPHERRQRAFYLAGQALAGWMLEHTDALVRVSIKPRTLGFGFTQTSAAARERHLLTREELLDRIAMSLAGRAAELQQFNCASSSAESDLRKVTDVAYRIVRSFGMSDAIGPLSFRFDVAAGDEFASKPYSQRLAHLIDVEARRLIGVAHQQAADLLTHHREKLNDLAEQLLARETLDSDEIAAILGPCPFGKKRTVEEIRWDLVDADGDTFSAGVDSGADSTEPADEDSDSSRD